MEAEGGEVFNIILPSYQCFTINVKVYGIYHSQSHLTENKLISIRQAAYLKGDTTTNQLLYIVNKIRSAWQQGNLVQGSFMDVDGVFEKVWRKGLIAKLEQASVTGNCIKLFQLY